MRVFEYTNKGNRECNQDYVVHELLSPSSAIFVVADGMGGYAHGEIASKLAAQSIVEYVESNEDRLSPAEMLREAVSYANESLMLKRIALGGEKMGTVIALLYVKDNSAFISWKGDSRVYLYRDGQEVYRTEDHSIINELSKIQSLKLEAQTIEKYASIVTQSIMGDDKLGKTSVAKVELTQKDIFVLCTDGYHKEISMQYALTYDGSQKDVLDDKAENISDNYSFIKVEI